VPFLSPFGRSRESIIIIQPHHKTLRLFETDRAGHPHSNQKKNTKNFILSHIAPTCEREKIERRC
jgi:hypothetical protein